MLNEVSPPLSTQQQRRALLAYAWWGLITKLNLTWISETGSSATKRFDRRWPGTGSRNRWRGFARLFQGDFLTNRVPNFHFRDMFPGRGTDTSAFTGRLDLGGLGRR